MYVCTSLSVCVCTVCTCTCMYMYMYFFFTDVLNCNHNQFACPDKCIDGDGVCDGEYDCIDNSDEINCGKYS